MSEALLSGWGRTAPSRATVLAPGGREELLKALREANGRGVIARGLGRSYNDAAQNAGGRVLVTTGLDGIADLDTGAGALTVDAGVSLDSILRLVVPRGWFLPVCPGTRFVTVGGAIACDVHGKNHAEDGTFGRHVEWIDLMLPSGEVRRTGPGLEPDLFAATAGGMGLTGVVLAARLRLAPIETPWMFSVTERVPDLDALLAAMGVEGDLPHSVAWVDPSARGQRLGRAVLSRGRHATRADLAGREAPRGPAFPARAPRVPGGPALPLVNPVSSAVLHRYRLWTAPRKRAEGLESPAAFFHPLDGLLDWNRLFGPRGLVQYQVAVPDGREELLPALIERTQAAGCRPVLMTLKRLGEAAGPLSFPLPGWTLALDFGAGVLGLSGLLDELDQLVAEAGGRVYLAKDGRLRPELLGAMYPRLPEWRAVRERVDPEARLRSDLARRLALA